jgi:hypothetical protein
MDNGKLPVGFAFSLAQNEEALNFFGTLDRNTQMQIKGYVQNVSTGDEAKQKINTCVECLAKKNTDFLS